MRRGYDSEFLTNDNGEIIGINLGADHCAEHEWGIKGIKESFKLNDNEEVFGIAKRIINASPENLMFKKVKIKNKIHYVLILLRHTYGIIFDEDYKKWLPSDLIPFSDKNMACAWDENSFGIVVTKEFKNEIESLYESFKNKDIAIGVAPSKAFSNGGLVFTITSKLPQEIIDDIYEKDLDYYNLQNTATATGIYDVLKNKGKKYYALSPRWKDENKNELVFWLNPAEQRKYNYGWFTIEDLEDWANDKGKIIMKN